MKVGLIRLVAAADSLNMIGTPLCHGVKYGHQSFTRFGEMIFIPPWIVLIGDLSN